MPDGHRTEAIEGVEHLREHISCDECRNSAWLIWKSNGCEHGLKSHKVNPDGSIKEIGDLAPQKRKKPKGVSSRQWEGGENGFTAKKNQPANRDRDRPR
jgi:hypothetical protein